MLYHDMLYDVVFCHVMSHVVYHVSELGGYSNYIDVFPFDGS